MYPGISVTLDRQVAISLTSTRPHLWTKAIPLSNHHCILRSVLPVENLLRALFARDDSLCAESAGSRIRDRTDKGNMTPLVRRLIELAILRKHTYTFYLLYFLAPEQRMATLEGVTGNATVDDNVKARELLLVKELAGFRFCCAMEENI